jgi:tRNA modification GTPase
MQFEDTIAAIATATGQGGIAILRISGPRAEAVLRSIFRPAKGEAETYPTHLLVYGHVIKGNEKIDEAMAVLMRAPRSYTREDVAEIHTHGGRMMASLALELAQAAGARQAEPGEFTRRAFLNGRLDLSQAEAVMGLIAAGGRQAAKAAMRQLDGGPSQFIREVLDRLYGLMAGLEAAIDYPEEVEEEEATRSLREGVLALAKVLEDACDERGVKMLEQGMDVVLCGRPNVGKSSLLNALLGEDRAIVTDVPGTTRDILTGSIEINGLPVTLNDTAGLRDTEDTVEKIGVSRAQKAMARADVVILVIDAGQPLSLEDEELLLSPPEGEFAVVLNKSDLAPMVQAENIKELCPLIPVIALSAKTGEGLTSLKAYLAEKAGDPSRLAITTSRHLDAARRAASSLRQAAGSLDSNIPLDLAAVDMRDALSALGEITGDEVEERVLDQVFSQFCVGK